jgi:hypothetical protein
MVVVKYSISGHFLHGILRRPGTLEIFDIQVSFLLTPIPTGSSTTEGFVILFRVLCVFGSGPKTNTIQHAYTINSKK